MEITDEGLKELLRLKDELVRLCDDEEYRRYTKARKELEKRKGE